MSTFLNSVKNVSVFDGYHNVDYSEYHLEIDKEQASFMHDLGIFKTVYSDFPTIGLSEIVYGYNAVSSLDPNSDQYHSTTIPLNTDIELSLAYTALSDGFGKPDLTKLVARAREASTTANLSNKITELVALYMQAHNMTLHSTIEQAQMAALFDLKAIDGEGQELNFETEMGKSVLTHDIALDVADTDVFNELDQIQQKIRKNLKQRVRSLEYILGIASPSYFRKIKSHASVKQYVTGSGFKPSFEVGFEGKYQICELDGVIFVCAPEEVAERLGAGNGCLYLPKLNADGAIALYPDFYTESQRKIDGVNVESNRDIRFCTYTVTNDKQTRCDVITDTSWLPVVRDPSVLVRSNWA
ncbi:hypothetical protein [Photobacterium damselae]|uniref:hypothetical protein n=1 Tax=Photobacterium damselae TaxID=38293 RepID=UPI0040688293